MNTSINIRIKIIVIVLIGSLLIGRSHAQSLLSLRGPVTPQVSDKPKTLHESNLGNATNFLQCEINNNWLEGHRILDEISIYLLQLPSTITQTSQLETNQIADFMRRMRDNDWAYYMATNFCGPMELLDSSGQKVPLLKPEVGMPGTYPAFFSFAAAENAFMARFHGFVSNPQAFPTGIVQARTKLASFKLADFFDVKKMGQYRLTSWPKIYKRSTTNTDLLERVDLPPVSITILWDDSLK